MDLSKLDDEQVNVALKVIEAAKKHGVNPDFVLPMVNAESGFRPNASSGKAYGPMQLTPATAQGLGVDPQNVDENIDGGMRLLKSLIENKNLKGEPRHIFAAYNAGPNAKFFETHDLADLPDETVSHVLRVMGSYGDKVPSMTIEAQQPVATKEEAAPATDQYGPNKVGTQPTTPEESQRSSMETGAALGALGAGVGAVKVPIVKAVQRLMQALPDRNISVQDAVKMADSMLIPKVGTPEVGLTSGEKWAAKTGYGLGEGTTQEVSSRYQRALPQGKVSGRMAKLYGPAKAGESTQLSQRIIDRAAAAQEAQAAQGRLQQAEANFNAQMARAQQAGMPDTGQRMARAVLGSAPVKGGLAGFGVGLNLEDAYQKALQGDITGALTSGGAAASSGLSLVPQLASRATPLAVALTTASKARDELLRGNKQAAAETGLTGLTTLLPRIFGPLGAMVYSGGLNANEQQELDALRKQYGVTPP